MIQEKDFLYRVPVKTAPITTPRGQIRNPEILVDLEGGEFMHGNILDANSTNKLINQSIKDAVDDKFIESGYVTKDLLDAETTRATEQENSLKTLIGAETSARTKSDEGLSAKIKAEQTRAEGKEKEISDKLAIVDGDSNTEGSFRKAIADVIAAAPEDLDTLKEIADKLAGNDDLHTALNQAITEKADASALANEVTRATGVESGLQAAIATKADATALSNYVLTTALNQQVDTLNAAISAKQDAGNYIPYDDTDTTIYKIGKPLKYKTNNGEFGFFDNDKRFYIGRSDSKFEIISNSFGLSTDGRESNFTVYGFTVRENKNRETIFSINQDGIEFKDRKNTEVPVADGSGFADLNNYAKKSELPTVPTKTSELTNDSNFIAAADVDDDSYRLQKSLQFGGKQTDYVTIGSDGVVLNAAGNFHLSGLGLQGGATGSMYKIGTNGIELREMANAIKINPRSISSIVNDMTNLFFIDSSGIVIGDINNPNVKISEEGIKFKGKTTKDIPTANGTFVNSDDFASVDDVSSLRAGLTRKQNKITVNEVDITDIETADITKLRTIVTNLINALNSSGLINTSDGVE